MELTPSQRTAGTMGLLLASWFTLGQRSYTVQDSPRFYIN